MVKIENGDIICNRGSAVEIGIALLTEEGEPYELAENETLVVNIFNSDNVKTVFECVNGACTVDGKTTNLLTGCYYYSVSVNNKETGDINGVYPPHRFIILD